MEKITEGITANAERFLGFLDKLIESQQSDSEFRDIMERVEQVEYDLIQDEKEATVEGEAVHIKDRGPILVPNESFVHVDTRHYDMFTLELTPEQIVAGNVRVDPYQVASTWKLGEKDSSGCLFHMLKTIARFGVKEGNNTSREIASLEATLKRFKELQAKKFSKK